MYLNQLVKEVPGLFLDPEDLARYGWYTANFNGKYVFVTYLGRKVWTLQQLLLRPPEGYQVDHIDRNTLNYARSNLRVVTLSEQAVNKDLNILNTSGYKGVTWHTKSGKWRACLTKRINGKDKHFHVGLFSVIEHAALAYNQAALQIHGTNAALNAVKEN